MRTSGSRLDLHVEAGRQIKCRIPPYDQVETGRHALSMFLGFVNFAVGQGKQRSRLRCLIAMIRDYDDSRTGASFTQQEREQQLEVDRRDLSLYTTTFFRNVQKFVRDSLAREENRILSTDVSQIARNWYSSGMDYISLQLRQRLDHLLENRTDFRLGGLRRELMDTFFDSILEVLLRPEERPGSEGKEILLESFPFDRLLHIPLGLGSAEGARLCYARTRINDVKERGADKDSWSALDARSCYERIRRDGRTWPQSNGRKSTAEINHFGFADESRVASEELAGVLETHGAPQATRRSGAQPLRSERDPDSRRRGPDPAPPRRPGARLDAGAPGGGGRGQHPQRRAAGRGLGGQRHPHRGLHGPRGGSAHAVPEGLRRERHGSPQRSAGDQVPAGLVRLFGPRRAAGPIASTASRGPKAK